MVDRPSGRNEKDWLHKKDKRKARRDGGVAALELAKWTSILNWTENTHF
jgi:hypothetical protein